MLSEILPKTFWSLFFRTHYIIPAREAGDHNTGPCRLPVMSSVTESVFDKINWDQKTDSIKMVKCAFNCMHDYSYISGDREQTMRILCVATSLRYDIVSEVSIQGGATS